MHHARSLGQLAWYWIEPAVLVASSNGAWLTTILLRISLMLSSPLHLLIRILIADHLHLSPSFTAHLFSISNSTSSIPVWFPTSYHGSHCDLAVSSSFLFYCLFVSISARLPLSLLLSNIFLSISVNPSHFTPFKLFHHATFSKHHQLPAPPQLLLQPITARLGWLQYQLREHPREAERVRCIDHCERDTCSAASISHPRRIERASST